MPDQVKLIDFRKELKAYSAAYAPRASSPDTTCLPGITQSKQRPLTVVKMTEKATSTSSLMECSSSYIVLCLQVHPIS